MKSGNLDFLEPSGPLQACNGTALTFTLHKLTSLSPQKFSIYCLKSMWPWPKEWHAKQVWVDECFIRGGWNNIVLKISPCVSQGTAYQLHGSKARYDCGNNSIVSGNQTNHRKKFCERRTDVFNLYLFKYEVNLSNEPSPSFMSSCDSGKVDFH